MTSACECAIEALLKNSFSSLSFTDKSSIVQSKTKKTSMLWPSQNFLLYKCSTLI